MPLILDGTLGISGVNGSAGTPSYQGTDNNTGIFYPAADTIAFAEGGVEVMRIDSSGNVGIGTNSPNGILQAGATGNSLIFNNSSFSELSPPTTGNDLYMFRSQNDGSFNFSSRPGGGGSYRFWVGSTQVMRITSAGSVGIGTATPSSKLEVLNGAITAGASAIILNGRFDDSFPTSGAGYFQLRTNNADATTGGLSVFTNNAGTLRQSYIVAETGAGNSYHAWNTGGSERMRIDSTGRLLINATTARTTLDGDRSALVQIEGTSVDQGLSMFRNENGAFGPTFWLGKSRGTTTGSNTAVQSGDGLGSIAWLGTDGTKPLIAALITTQVDGTPGTNDMPGRLVFFTTADGASSVTERMRITSGGNLLVGTSAAGADAGFSTRLAVDGGSSVDPSIFKWSGAAGSAYPIRTWNTATSGNNLFVDFATETAYTSRGFIDYNRGAGQVRYNTTSDATLKNIIGDSDNQKSVDILKSTRIREYAWKDDAEQKPQVGVIAQELYETYKGAVSVGCEDKNGNYRPWGVDKTAFTFHLIAGWQAHEKIIKEQQAMIESQQKQIDALRELINGNQF